MGSVGIPAQGTGPPLLLSMEMLTIDSCMFTYHFSAHPMLTPFDGLPEVELGRRSADVVEPLCKPFNLELPWLFEMVLSQACTWSRRGP